MSLPSIAIVTRERDSRTATVLPDARNVLVARGFGFGFGFAGFGDGRFRGGMVNHLVYEQSSVRLAPLFKRERPRRARRHPKCIAAPGATVAAGAFGHTSGRRGGAMRTRAKSSMRPAR